METYTNHLDGERVEKFDGSSSIPVYDDDVNSSRVLEKNKIGSDFADVDVNNTPLKAASEEDSADSSRVNENSKELKLGLSIDQNRSGNLAEGHSLSLTQGRRRGRPSKIKAIQNSNSDSNVDPDKNIGDNLGSISQRTRNRVVKGKKEEVKSMNIEQNNSESIDEYEYNHETRFSVGDFVWGKIKSYPWWPGRIYDPKNASDFGIRYSHEGRLLVAYFGDRTFAWCDSSQLKPFEEDFEEMSKQSSLKNFVNAVNVAVNEYCLSLQMTKQQSQTALPLVVNAGIKEGVRVSLDGMKKFSGTDFDTNVILDELRSFARTISVTNMLVLGVLKSYLSNFYYTKGGYSLPVFYEPSGIEELEENDSGPVIGLARGPDEGDWSEIPEDLSVAQTGPETPNCKSRKRRKVKSISEIMALDAKVELEGNPGASESGKRKMKRKFIDDDKSDVVENSVITRSGSRKKEESREENDKRKTKSLSKERKLSIRLGGEKNNGHIGEEELQERISPREKKISKYLSPPYTSPLQKQRSFGSVGGPLELSDVAKVAAGKLVGSPPIVKCSGETPQKESGFGKTGSITTVGSPDEVLCEMRSAARDPLNTKKVHRSLDKITGFLSPYRSANYKNGSDFNLYKKQKSDSMENGELSNGSISSAELVIKFPEEFPLPTKNDLMEIYSKFGKLDEEKTEVIPETSSAKVVYLRKSDAEASMDSMKKSSPFGNANVSYEIPKKKKHSPTKPENEQSLAVIFIKQKLEEMNSMLAKTDGKMSEETKSKLEKDVKELLKKVKMMTASSSSTSTYNSTP